MKVCIFGAGAIGGYIAAELAHAGDAEVTCIARGPHLAAMKENGLKLVYKDGTERNVRVNATDDPAEAGPQDFVFVTLKAHSSAAVADKMAPLFGPETALVTGQNGVPWWYFYKLEGKYEGTQVQSVDPGHRQWDLIGPERAIGCVVYPAAEIAEPGVIHHAYGNRFSIGEPSGEKTDRVQALSKLMGDAGLRAPVRPRIRDDMWVKIWGNVSLNPISALTGGTLAEMIDDSEVCGVIRASMIEAQQSVKPSASSSLSMSKSALLGPVKWGTTRHPCCMIWNLGARWRSMRLWRPCKSWVALLAWRRRQSISCSASSNSAHGWQVATTAKFWIDALPPQKRVVRPVQRK